MLFQQQLSNFDIYAKFVWCIGWLLNNSRRREYVIAALVVGAALSDIWLL